MKKYCIAFVMLVLMAVASLVVYIPTASAHAAVASVCKTTGAPLVNVHFKVINDDDSGVAGNAWASDSFIKTIQVWSTSNHPLGPNTYCATVGFVGKFVTRAGVSPAGSNTVSAGIKGTFSGGYLATFTGTFAPTLKTKGNLGIYDYNCNGAFNCPGSFDWVSAYFPGYTNFAQPYWAWKYIACHHHGMWINASTGNSGDITG